MSMSGTDVVVAPVTVQADGAAAPDCALIGVTAVPPRPPTPPGHETIEPMLVVPPEVPAFAPAVPPSPVAPIVTAWLLILGHHTSA